MKVILGKWPSFLAKDLRSAAYSTISQMAALEHGYRNREVEIRGEKMARQMKVYGCFVAFDRVTMRSHKLVELHRKWRKAADWLKDATYGAYVLGMDVR